MINFLAHAYLSFHHEKITVGNLLSDFIKGNRKLNFSEDVQNGILLHRFIDQFTDENEFTKRGNQIFKNDYRLYGRVFMDVIYDHFLANDKNIFPENELRVFTHYIYDVLKKNKNIIPEDIFFIFQKMISNDVFYNYKNKWGVDKSFQALVRRAKYMDDDKTVSILFREHYDELEACYNNFFPQILQASKAKYEELANS